MKKIYVIIIFVASFFSFHHSFSQCSTPTFNNGCSIALDALWLYHTPTATTLINDTETACSGPSSSDIIKVTAGASYYFELSVISAEGSDNTSAFFSIWLDKNNDGDFDDTGERLYYNNSTEIYKYGAGDPDYAYGKITIPTDALTGTNLKFRVLVVAANNLGESCSTDPSDATCGTYCGGEIHDYTFNVAEAPICPLTFENGCSMALHNFSLASVSPAATLINDVETACSGPASSSVINVTAGENYNFDLTVYSAGGSDNTSAFYSIWLDKNNDGLFDTGERLFYNNTTEIYKLGYGPPESASGSITIPTDALTGTDLKFRVLVVAASNMSESCNTDPSDACGTYCGGEVHDYTFNIAPPPCVSPDAPSLSYVSACSGTNITLTATCSTGTPNWYESSTATTALASGSYTINNIAAPGTNYYVSCETSPTCVSNRVEQSTVVMETPAAPSAAGTEICSGSTADLTASCTSGLARWYESNTSTSILGVNSFTTPILSGNTTYYVACESGESPTCASTRTQQSVQVNELPTSPTASGQTICSGSTASLSASCAEGSTVMWYSDITGGTFLGTGTYETPTLTINTSYFVECERNYGSIICHSTRTEVQVTVNNVSPPTADGQSICSGSTAALTASCSSGTPKWYESDTSITVLASGSYTTPALTIATTYYVACESGESPTCISQRTPQTVQVYELPTPPKASGQTICSGSTASLSASCFEGTTVMWYSDITGGTFLGTDTYETPTLTINTSYFVECERNYESVICHSTRTEVLVTVNDTSPPTANGTAICSGSTAALTASCTSGTAKWYESSTSITVLASGSYTTPVLTTPTTYYVACESGESPTCVSTRTAQTVQVNAIPSPPSASGQTICSGSTASLSASCAEGTTVMWYSALTGGIFLGTGTYTTPTLTTPISYFVECERNYESVICHSTRVEVLVTVNPNPSPPTANGTAICSGSTAALTASCTAGTAKWYESNTSITVLASGSYTTPVLTTPTTYYVACESGESPTCVSTRTAQTVQVNAIPSPPSASGQTICSGSTASLSASCAEGSSVMWYSALTGGTFLGAGTYTTPTLTNPISYFVECERNYEPVICHSTRIEVLVTVNPNPSPPTANGTAICSGSTAALTASCTSGTAKWYESNTSITVLASGSYTTPVLTTPTTYYVACESGGSPNCVSTRTAQTVQVNAIPSPPSASGQTICSGLTASLSASCAEGTTVMWYSALTGGTFLGAGTYTTPTLTNPISYFVECERNYEPVICHSTRVEVLVSINPNPTIPSISSNKTLICNTETATLQATGCNGTVKWSNTSTGTSITVSLGGTYTAVCENGCGTSGNSNIIIIDKSSTPAAPIASSDKNFICEGENATLSAYGCTGTLNWNNGATTNSIQVNVSGTFSATCSNNCGTSSRSNEVIITKSLNPIQPTINLSSPILCGESSKTLTATGCNGQIRWNTNITGTSLTVTTAGTYSAVCETPCGVSIQSNIINVQFLIIPTATATNTGPYELGQKIQLSGSGGATYSWRGPDDFLSTNANVSILNASLADGGIYTLTVTNASGCSATTTTNVVVNPCSQVFKFDYVKAGDDFHYFFPITDGMKIAALTINTGILATPFCQLDTISTQSVRLKMTGPEPLFNRDIIEKIFPYSPFENKGFQIFGPIFPPGEYTLTTTGYSKDDPSEGIITFGPQTIHFTIVANAPNILLANPNLTQICAGSSLNVGFETIGTFNEGNKFEIQLSDANGSFEFPIKIGETTSAGIVNCEIPANLPAGSGYQIRIFGTNPALMSSTSSSTFVVNPRSITLQSPDNDISTIINKKAAEKITATNKVFSEGKATYEAGRFILLQPGFAVNSSGVFKAEIKGCTE